VLTTYYAAIRLQLRNPNHELTRSTNTDDRERPRNKKKRVLAIFGNSWLRHIFQQTPKLLETGRTKFSAQNVDFNRLSFDLYSFKKSSEPMRQSLGTLSERIILLHT